MTGREIHNIDEPDASGISGFALFRLGFRPFFLFGPLFGLLAFGYFILWISEAVSVWPSTWDALVWHRHEMLFGFAGAIIAGFLLTAVPNWTGHPTPKGMKLALVVLLWFAGRVAVFFSASLPAMLVVAVDVSFFLVCAGCILPALIKAKNLRNYLFIVLLLLLAVANGMTHWGDEENTDIANMGIRLALSVIVMMMVILGGRVIPFFTERPLGITIKRDPRIERFTLIATVAALVLSVADINETVLGVVLMLAAIANGWRLSQWQSLKTLGTPLLWVLHAGYAWLVVGFAMKGFYHLGLEVPSTTATHAFTAGGIGVLTLGMMARVALGHSGRPLVIGKAMVCAFGCVNIAAIIRVFAVPLFPSFTMHWFEAAALFWLVAFSIFVAVYAPILVRPRLDGRDG